MPLSKPKKRFLQPGASEGVSVEASADWSTVTGVGEKNIIAGTTINVKVQAKDANNVAKTSGGDVF